MAKEIRYDPVTGKFTFSLEVDGRRTESVRPQRFSEVDKYGKYRRAGKQAQKKE